MESLVLALAGGAAGMVCRSGSRPLMSVLPWDSVTRSISPRPTCASPVHGAALDHHACGAVRNGAGLQGSKPELNRTLREEAGLPLGRSAPRRFRKTLVVAQVALSMLLIAGAGCSRAASTT